jgi:hypothetical protein
MVSKHPLNSREQRVGHERLFDDRDASRGRRDANRTCRLRADENRWKLGCPGSELVDQLQTVHARKIIIHHQAACCRKGASQKRFSAFKRLHLKTVEPEGELQRRAEGGILIHEDDRWLFGAQRRPPSGVMRGLGAPANPDGPIWA